MKATLLSPCVPYASFHPTARHSLVSTHCTDRRACRTTPRTVPPLHTSGHRGSEAVAPLRVFSPDTVYSANEVIAGVAGGSVGVLGTLIQLELKQVRKQGGRNKRGRDREQGTGIPRPRSTFLTHSERGGD